MKVKTAIRLVATLPTGLGRELGAAAGARTRAWLHLSCHTGGGNVPAAGGGNELAEGLPTVHGTMAKKFATVPLLLA